MALAVAPLFNVLAFEPGASAGVLSHSSPAKLPSTDAAKPTPITFGIAPANPTKPDGRPLYQYFGGPGGVFSDHAALENFSNETLTVRVTGAYAENTSVGGFALQPPNKPPRDVGTWIHVDGPSTISIPPRSVKIVTFSVDVPPNATPGDHVGGIQVTLESLIRSKSGQNLKLLQSVGARLFLRVNGPVEPRLTIEHLKVRYHGTLNPIRGGTALLTYTVANTGNVVLGGVQKVWVTGFFSGMFGDKTVSVHVPDLQLLLPGNAVVQSVKIPDVYPQIWMKAHVSITQLIIAGAEVPQNGPYRASTSFLAIPWILLGIVLALIIGTIVWLLWRRRRRRRQRAGSDGVLSPAPTPAGASATDADAETAAASERPLGGIGDGALLQPVGAETDGKERRNDATT